MENKSPLKYFTSEQVAKIKQDYAHLIGNPFLFSEKSNETSIVADIIASPSADPSTSKYFANIRFENSKELRTFQFMKLNKMEFDFEFYYNFRTA